MKRIIKLLVLLFVGFVVFSTGLTTYETIEVKSQIKDFISKGELKEDISTDKIKYYEVPRETWQPDIEPFYEGDITKPGVEGDIFVTRQSPMVGMPFLYNFASFFFGGHASYMGENNKVYEVAGFPGAGESYFKVLFKGGEKTVVRSQPNYWLNSGHRAPGDKSYQYYGEYYRTEWIGLRMKDVTKEDITMATNYMKDLKERKVQYNHFYIINTKTKVYCTDMMANAYHTITNSNGERKYNLNRDGVAVTVNDLILSKDTYMTYYFKVDKKGVAHFYYLT